MEERKRKNRRSLLITVLVLALIVAIPLIAEQRQEKLGGIAGDEVISENPEYVTIEKVLSGTGTLEPEEAEKVEIPKGVEVTEYLVSNTAEVKEGDPLAKVDKASVMVAIAECQERMERLEKEMDEQRNWLSFSDESMQLDASHYLNYRVYTAYNDTDIHEYIYSPVNGVLTARYAEKGDNVKDVILEHGCLAVITFDNGYEYKVTASNGDVNYAYYSVGDEVKSGAALFYLENCTNDAQVEVMAKKHRKLEESMEKLSKYYIDGVVTAPCDGIITGIDEDAAAKLETKKKNAHVIQADVLAEDRPMESGGQSVTISGTISQYSDPVFIETSDGKTIKVSKSEFSNLVTGFLSTLLESGYQKEGIPLSLTYVVTYPTSDGPQLELKRIEINYNEVPGVSGSSVSVTGGGGGGMTGGNTASFSSNGSSNQDDPYAVQYTTIMSVTPQHEMTVAIAIDELDILSVSTGMETIVSIDAFPGHSYTGTITNINTSGSNSGGNSKYKAVVTLERQPSMIAGMNASVLIPIESYENILAIPSKAVCEENGKTFVYTGYDDKTKALVSPVYIETGLSDGEYVQVISGLTENDTVKFTYKDKIDISTLMGPPTNMSGMPGGFSFGGSGGRP